MATDWFATQNGAGAQNGTNIANAWAIQDGVDNVNTPGDILRICGNVTINAQLDFDTNDGTRIAPIYYKGYSSDGTTPQQITITRTSADGYVMAITTDWLVFEQITAANANTGSSTYIWNDTGSHNTYLKCKADGGYKGWVCTGDYTVLIAPEVNNAASVGYSLSGLTYFKSGTGHDVTYDTFQMLDNVFLEDCAGLDNGRYDFGGYLTSEAGMVVVSGCGSRNVGDAAFWTRNGTTVVINSIAASATGAALEVDVAGLAVIRFGNTFPTGGAEANGSETAGNPTTIGGATVKADLVAAEDPAFEGAGDFRLGAGSDSIGQAGPDALPFDL